MSKNDRRQIWKLGFEKNLREYEKKLEKYQINFESVNELIIELFIKNATIAKQVQQIDQLKENQTLLKEKVKDHPKVIELNSQIEALKTSQQDLYKNNAINAQRIVSLMDNNKLDSDRIKKLMNENKELERQIGSLKRGYEDASSLLKEKDRVIEILKDELAAHQLELVQREEDLIKLKEKRTALEADNKTLLDRWIQLKEKDALKMNEKNESLGNAFATNVSVANRVFSMFRSPASESLTSEEVNPPREYKLNASLLPNGAVKSYKSVHEDDINCIAISKDGRTIATGGTDKKLILYNSSSGQPKGFLHGSLKSIMYICFSDTGDLVMSTSNDMSIKLWDPETRNLRHTLTGHVQNIYGARFLSATTVVSGSHDRTIKFWDLQKGYCTKNIFTLSSCNDVTPLNSSGSAIASGHFDNNLRIWDSKTGNLIKEVTNLHFQQITSVQVSPDERLILTTSRDNTLKVIDCRMFLPVFTLSAPGFRVATNWSRSCFSSDGTFIASGSNDGNVYVWKDGALATTLSKHGSSVVGVIWDPAGGSTLYSVADKERTIVQWGTVD